MGAGAAPSAKVAVEMEPQSLVRRPPRPAPPRRSGRPDRQAD